ncbi:hypothetical protein HZS_4881 [Henneguya salminicola]|nr:hypothetical protein HZS_4881 [Henneguya salminicola]
MNFLLQYFSNDVNIFVKFGSKHNRRRSPTLFKVCQKSNRNSLRSPLGNVSEQGYRKIYSLTISSATTLI